jgi:hypothetical protein
VGGSARVKINPIVVMAGVMAGVVLGDVLDGVLSGAGLGDRCLGRIEGLGARDQRIEVEADPIREIAEALSEGIAQRHRLSPSLGPLMGIEEPAAQVIGGEADDHGVSLVDESTALTFEQGTGVSPASAGSRADHDAGAGLLSGAHPMP